MFVVVCSMPKSNTFLYRIWWGPGEPGHHPPLTPRHVFPLKVEATTPGSIPVPTYLLEKKSFIFKHFVKVAS